MKFLIIVCWLLSIIITNSYSYCDINFKYADIKNFTNSTVQILTSNDDISIQTRLYYAQSLHEMKVSKINDYSNIFNNINMNFASRGSGLLINENGYIITNYHVVESVDNIFIGIIDSNNIKKSPSVDYLAKTVAISKRDDLAILKIIGKYSDDDEPFTIDNTYTSVRTISKFKGLREKIKINSFKLSNSDNINLGETIYILGYPSIGGETLTFTTGVVSGFINNGNYIKTDAEINPGNSGGIALNCKFKVIGLTTAVTTDKIANGKIGLVTPINKAKNLIKYYNKYLSDRK